MLRKFRTHTSLPETPSAPNNIKSSYDELMLGVWRVLVVKDSHFSMFNFRLENLSTTFPLLRRALYDVYTISPRLFALTIMTHFWFAIEGPLSLYFSNRLFFFIEKRISGGFPNDQTPYDLYLAVISRVACSVLSAYMRWWSGQNEHTYSSRIKYEYQARVFSGEPRIALISKVSDYAASRIDTENVYRCLQRGIMLLNNALSFLLHLHFVAHVIGSGLNDGGPVFLALCMLPPFLRHFMSSDLWTKVYVASATNKYYIRKSALGKLVEAELKQEVMAGGVKNFLMNEYRKAKDGLGDTPDTEAEVLYSQQHESLSDIIVRLCSDSPILYFALLALISPSKLTIIQLAILDQTSTSLRYTFEAIGWAIDLWPGDFSRMRNVYAVLDTKNKTKDGETPFPRPGFEASAGMGIEVRDVSFSYPGNKSERAALSGVSFTIQPGQLVVIVGANGSGKSTIIKLLSRFYEPTSGSILVDGISIEEYSMNELRKGIAMLTQEHQLFPLSVEENIKLGSSNAEAMDDQQKIRESVLAAGAEGIVNNFSDGYDMVLEPVMTGYLSYAGQGNRELEAIQKNMEKPTSISGKWPLVEFARTFMRLFTSSIKLVTVDEPSSALDPEAEYQLFANLRQQRNGRTMIFVTHRFGHLTKYADLIICIKKGAVVETGTHADLLLKGGEYAHLYNVQAQAFATI
ncbi:P-loop containing nucleoside triphosphate hydrolase protein [Lanmaoa asiatica]|nr:P-loop containing nucleoside triphosphate hydrolase protein [Lanmaoa asiatica]